MSADASLAALGQRYGARYRWLLLLATMIGTMASVMSATVVNVAIPDMSHVFSLSQERAQWVSSGFMVAMTVSMLTTPWLLARYGYRATYVGAMVLLMTGGIVGGLAAHYPLVLAARVVEGLAAGVVQPIPAIIILRAFEPRDQGRASGLFGMGVVLAPALGPSVGGLLVDWFGWRSIFFMVVPLCLLSIVLARRFVPTSAPGGVLADRSGPQLDWVGLALGTAATLCLLNGLLDIRGSDTPAAVGLLVAALGLLAALIAWLRRAGRRGDPALLNLSLFGHRTFGPGSLVSFIYGVALYGSTYLLPVYMQLGLSLPASSVGAILLPAGIVLAITIGLAGRMLDRVPIYLMVSGGLALLALSFVLMATVGLGTALVWLAVWAVLGRIGLGLVMPSLNLGSLRELPKPLLPEGASAINFLRTLGGAAGVSLCALVLEWRLAAHGASLTGPGTSFARVTAFHETFVMLAVVCALAMLAAWRLRGGNAGD
ncbi:MFS transporter [Ramlibacter rhizophilus]|uniref:MFS transporter n=1 Tax=Ramlibacter rhizophilus TaxID=1781167 RepID=A0A4Z0BZU9_9BURK|nr:MFS transporter [Ramlibacter rhizophilus]TFZ04826.1 MFS transporter [Ramlibacter rhizophilus]